MAAGIKDVAREAGVSISTVSYVMSGKRSIAPATQERVKKVADELGYIPKSVTPSGRRSAKTNVFAISAPVRNHTDVSNYAVFFFALATAAKKHGYDILLLMDEDADQELVRVVREGMVDGIFLLDVEMNDSRAETAARLSVPVVSVGWPGNGDAVYAVDSDFGGMGREAAEKAKMLGRDHVLLTGAVEQALREGSNFLSRFVDGFHKRADELGLAVTEIMTAGQGVDDAVLTLDTALAEDPDISAIVCAACPPFAGALYVALSRRGLSVPGDMSMLLAMGAAGSASQMAHAIDELPMNPNAVCRRAVETMMQVVEGKRRNVGSVELLPFDYRAHGTMVKREA
ncbi:LacI family DNA-binding transcriptional regulator [Bifidobacterium choloepi]|uniref:LacI family transcriptional regulator n=1 Tax=Bifidobacterium choloepi TaxID=2614131 RepID=A0A6I5NH15_9BIFI|nr:LacI family DNA-binding transcriptional regulator [Bifidobacterium choloepi]NEG70534.1 LacI family transcriptional regulator [Bifidobacterium choloepi]